MGNNSGHSKQSEEYYRFPYESYSRINGRIWQHCQNIEDQLKQYQVRLNSKQQGQILQKVFIFRKNSDYLVQIQYLDTRKEDQLCAFKRQGVMFLQNELFRLSDLRNIPFPDYLHLYHQCLKGFGILYDQYGAFGPDEEHICINSSLKVKVWIHRQLNQTIPEHLMASSAQTQMLRQVLFLLRRNLIDQSQFRKQNLHQYIQNQVSFQSANQALNRWCKRQGVSIPQKLNYLKKGVFLKSLKNLVSNQFENEQNFEWKTTNHQDISNKNIQIQSNRINHKITHSPQFNQPSRKSIREGQRSNSTIKPIISLRSSTQAQSINNHIMQNVYNDKVRDYSNPFDQIRQNLQTSRYISYSRQKLQQKPKTVCINLSHIKNSSQGQSLLSYKKPMTQSIHYEIKPSKIAFNQSRVQIMTNPVNFRKNFVDKRQRVIKNVTSRLNYKSTNQNTRLQVKEVSSQFYIAPLEHNHNISNLQIWKNQNSNNNTNFHKIKQNSIQIGRNILKKDQNHQIKTSQETSLNNFEGKNLQSNKNLFISRTKKNSSYIQKASSPSFSLKMGTRRVDSVQDTSPFISEVDKRHLYSNDFPIKLFLPYLRQKQDIISIEGIQMSFKD